MSDDPWIIVPNWDKFQHYTDRDPLWIKVYVELNSSDAWCDLSDAERGLLVTVWIEYARARGVLKVSRLPAKVGQKSRKGQLQRLNHAGWIEISATKPLALTRSREKKERREELGADVKKPRKKESTPTSSRVNCPKCGVSLAGPRMQAEHLYLTHGGPEPIIGSKQKRRQPMPTSKKTGRKYAAGSQKKYGGWEPRACHNCGAVLTLKHTAMAVNPTGGTPFTLCGECIDRYGDAYANMGPDHADRIHPDQLVIE